MHHFVGRSWNACTHAQEGILSDCQCPQCLFFFSSFLSFFPLSVKAHRRIPLYRLVYHKLLRPQIRFRPMGDQQQVISDSWMGFSLLLEERQNV